MADRSPARATPRPTNVCAEGRALPSRRRGPDWVRLAATLTSPGLARVEDVRREALRLRDPFAIAARALEALEVAAAIGPGEEENLPSTGAVVVVANHPFGGLDGLAAIATLGRRRRDLRILANRELAALEGI